MMGEASRCRDTWSGTPNTQLATSFGKPASSKQFEYLERGSRRFLGGLMMMEQPAPIAAPNFRAGLPMGKFHGQKAATGPTGSFMTRDRVPAGTHQHASIDAMHFAGVEIEQVGRHHDFGLGFRQRLAFLHRSDGRDPIDALAQQLSRTREHAAAIGGSMRLATADSRVRRCPGRGPNRRRWRAVTRASVAPVAGLTTR